MLGKKKYQPRLFVIFYLPDVIPEDNFYRILKSKLDLRFVYKLTKDIYSHTGTEFQMFKIEVCRLIFQKRVTIDLHVIPLGNNYF